MRTDIRSQCQGLREIRGLLRMSVKAVRKIRGFVEVREEGCRSCLFGFNIEGYIEAYYQALKKDKGAIKTGYYSMKGKRST